MRILVVTQYFWPENFKINDLVSELEKKDHQVTVLTGKPNYPAGVTFQEFKEDPKKFNKFNKSNIVRVPILTRGKGNSFKLIMNYLSYSISAILLGSWKLRGRQYDLIFVFEPSPITVGLPAIFFKKLKKAPVVFWVLDLWPETLEALGVVKSKPILSLVGYLVRFIYNRCDLILGQSKAFYKSISTYCEDNSKIRYFPNWSESIFSDKKVSPVDDIYKYKDTFKILFAGNLGQAQDFPSILKAVEILKDKKANVKFFIVGDGRAYDWVEEQISVLNLEKYVYLLGRHHLTLMPSFYASADALLVTLKEHAVFSMTIPGKLQSYMAAGKPLLTMMSGEGSRIVEEAECGYVANSGSYKILAKNILSMCELGEEDLNNLGKKAELYALKEFDRIDLISRLNFWFEELKDNSKRKIS